MLIIHTESSACFGGQELRVIEEMEWFQRRGHEVWLAAAEKSPVSLAAQARGLRVAPVAFRGAVNLVAIRRLSSACSRHGAQLLVAHGSRDAISAVVVSRLLGLPLVRYQHICKVLKDDFFQRLLWSRGNNQIVAVSESIRRRLLDQKLARAESIQVIGEHVDSSHFNPGVKPDGVRARHGIPMDAPLVMNLGMIRPDKGQRLLIEASAEIWQKHPRCWFMFVGSATRPEFFEELQACVRRSAQPERFVFAGFQNDPAPYLAASDIICLTSEIEAQSKVIPQAFAMGKLVVAPNLGGISELIQHAKNGLLYERKEPGALAATFDQAFHCDREKITANALASAKQLDLDRVMERTEKLYASLLA